MLLLLKGVTKKMILTVVFATGSVIGLTVSVIGTECYKLVYTRTLSASTEYSEYVLIRRRVTIPFY